MNIFQDVRTILEAALTQLVSDGVIPNLPDLSRVSVEPPRDPSHGDVALNAAMVLAKPLKMKPRDLAGHLLPVLLTSDRIDAAEIAGPGFINLRLSPVVWEDVLRAVLKLGTAYGGSDQGQSQPVNVEYVSANPTGPMHVGHARGACVGDVLAGLLAKAGWAVTREYYVNDAGVQVDVLARSVHARYRQALGLIDEGDIQQMLADGEIQYGGDYLIPLASGLAEMEDDRWAFTVEEDWLPYFREQAIDAMLDLIRNDLRALGIKFDVFSSEAALVRSGHVEKLLSELEARDLIYTGVLEPPKGKPPPEDWEPRPQTLFRATQFGDDVDRPLKKADGAFTYFANDIGYHHDKFRRGFNKMIDIFGADHGGYVKRMTAAVKAASDGAATLDVRLCQLVNLTENGEKLKMSKRAGTFVTLREVVERVGKDVVRFMMLTRKNDAPLDFDFAKVTEQTRDNPVFYVQYAHARCCSVLRHAAATDSLAGQDLSADGLSGLESLADLTKAPEDVEMIRILAQWPRVIEAAAEAREPHRLAYYLGDVAAGFHSLWNKGNEATELRFLLPDDPETTLVRLALVQGVKTVIASGLDVMGVTPMEEMH